MDEKMVRQDEVRQSRQVHLEKTRCFIATVANKALIAPVAFRIEMYIWENFLTKEDPPS